MESIFVECSSLNNFSKSPGWTKEETEVLRLSIMKYGLGNWKEILSRNLIPGKTRTQLTHHVMRMMGQQSTAFFKGIHFDTNQILKINQNDSISKRKGGIIIKKEKSYTKQEIETKRKKNEKKYGISSEEIDKISIPILPGSGTIKMWKIRKKKLEERINLLEKLINEKKENQIQIEKKKPKKNQNRKKNIKKKRNQKKNLNPKNEKIKRSKKIEKKK
ncbi:ubiquitin-associated/translation elongation factor ef1b n-terminal eukaryote [Anaeramoeba ignava]|uniref:Ubiquitin-associated/translation elongation factor ef1b n-terminal eukaryote n=1 Tax=Anaeramoeba ignava TaxID=1746090 RepID=A0A9Q0L5I2_ANAIG|nr:ubiquitin-associated/translation elongation factor ef1b n-terminal eukaryote [Anaeramoeba ignava]